LIIAWTNSFILIQQLKQKLEFLKEQTKKDTDKNENKQQRFRLKGVGNAESGWVVTGRDRENNRKIKWILVLALASCDCSLLLYKKETSLTVLPSSTRTSLQGRRPGKISWRRAR
jgi:hypothetical protein